MVPNQAGTLVLLSFVLLSSSCQRTKVSEIARPPELSKHDAKRILTHGGYKNVVVAAVITGCSLTPRSPQLQFVSAAPNVACVVGLGELGGELKEIQQEFFYDTEYGWMIFEIDKERRVVRRWTTSGYSKEGLAEAPRTK
jgi:hypothetical protein